MRQWRETAATIPRRVVASAAFSGSLLALLAFTPHAAADAGWSRTPGSALAGTSVRVASSPTALCQWLQPADPEVTSPIEPAPTVPQSMRPTAAEPDDADNPTVTADATGDPMTYDGTRVELRLEAAGVAVPIGSVPVTPGGAWSGKLALPDAGTIAAGEYELLARCVVDDPELDGVRSYDFDPLPFTIADAPPPTTITIPTELIPPITETKTDVEGARTQRAPVSTANATSPVTTLPNTGDGTLGVALAGIGALILGAGALWWGSRHTPSLPHEGSLPR